jgi:hypothetical protein
MAFMARLRNWCGRITARIADAIHVMAAARAAEVKTRRGGFGGRSGSTRSKPPSRRATAIWPLTKAALVELKARNAMEGIHEKREIGFASTPSALIRSRLNTAATTTPSTAQVCDAEFRPQPSEVVIGHRLTRVVLGGVVLKILEPGNELVTTLCCIRSLARPDVS